MLYKIAVTQIVCVCVNRVNSLLLSYYPYIGYKQNCFHCCTQFQTNFLLQTEWNMQHSQSMHCKTLTQSPRLAIPRCMYCWSREGQDWTRSTNQGGTLVERSQGQLCSHETWWSPSNSVHSLCVCMCMCVHSACMHFHMCMHACRERRRGACVQQFHTIQGGGTMGVTRTIPTHPPPPPRNPPPP